MGLEPEPLPDAEPTLAEQLRAEQERELQQAAIKKRREGGKLTRAELNALERFEREKDQRHGRRYVRSMPKKDYCEFSGRQVKVLLEQAASYGIPLRGEAVDVAAVIRWLHDFLAEHKHGLAKLLKSAALGEFFPGASDDDWQEKCWQERFYELRDKRLARERDMLPRGVVHQVHIQWAARLRKLAEKLAKTAQLTGPDAHRHLNEAMEDCERLLTALDTTDDDDSDPLAEEDPTTTA